MESIAKHLGLPSDASEEQILDVLKARSKDAETAAKTIEALSGDLSIANDKAAKAEARATQMERDGLMSDIRAAGKWSATLDAFLATQTNAQLRSWLADAPRVVPAGEVKPPADAPTSDEQLPPSIAALAAKGWKNLTGGEKHAVAKHSPDLAARLRRQAG
jgi:hypothetical protein